MSQIDTHTVRPGDPQTGGVDTRKVHIGDPDREGYFYCGIPVRVVIAHADVGYGPRGRDVCAVCVERDEAAR